MLSLKAILVATLISAPALADSVSPASFCGPVRLENVVEKSHGLIRFATFNASLNRNSGGDLADELATPGSPQPSAVAEIIQRSRPDVLLINEFDYDPGGESARLFQENYLEVGQNGAAPIHYPFAFLAESNTGIPSGLDLDNSGGVGGPGDAFGFGFFPGQFGMLLLSRYPIDTRRVRTFQKFLWRDMPGALLPDDPATPQPADWYSADELDNFRLSSKSHWDIPIRIRGRTVHVLASHPTPPVFDGPEDRNGTRNHDEIRFWADYVVEGSQSAYIVDDEGRRGGLKRKRAFVIMGDLNADPFDGDSTDNAVRQVLEHPLIDTSVTPASIGADDAAQRSGGLNDSHASPALFDTADFFDGNPGNLRVDYVLPSKRGIRPLCGGVFWPRQSEQLFDLVGDFPFPSSDHRLVWMDLKLTARKRR